MAGIEKGSNEEAYVEELADLPKQVQANKIADFFSSTRNKYEKLNISNFSDYFKDYKYDEYAENLVSPQIVRLHRTI